MSWTQNGARPLTTVTAKPIILRICNGQTQVRRLMSTLKARLLILRTSPLLVVLAVLVVLDQTECFQSAAVSSAIQEMRFRVQAQLT
jgi:hypothetical protein